MTPSVCVDSNLVINLVAHGPLISVVTPLWRSFGADGLTVVAPKLLHYELTNAFRRLVAAGRLPLPEAERFLADGLALPITVYGDDILHSEALGLAVEHGLPAAYDAHFLALAIRLGCNFYTADARLANTVQARLPWVKLVA